MSIILDGLTLPEDLIWRDEFEFSTIAQSKRRTITGALVVQESVKLKGRTILLEGGDTFAWITRAQLILLKAKTDIVDSTFTLNFHGTSYTVRFDRDNGPIKAQTIRDCTDPSPDDPYSITVALITV